MNGSQVKGDIEGNEIADKAAKEAAQSRSMNATPFKHKLLKTARVNLMEWAHSRT